MGNFSYFLYVWVQLRKIFVLLLPVFGFGIGSRLCSWPHYMVEGQNLQTPDKKNHNFTSGNQYSHQFCCLKSQIICFMSNCGNITVLSNSRFWNQRHVSVSYGSNSRIHLDFLTILGPVLTDFC